jgi:predicted phosphodiesterase
MIGIISDIHGNHIALLSVLSQLDAMGVSEIVCLGDIAGYYSQVNECCQTLQSRNIVSIMGNHDWYLVNNAACPRSNSANAALDYQHGIITPKNLKWLASLPKQRVIHDVQIVHGGWRDALDEYVTPSDEYFSAFPGTYFASGHTHKQCLWSGVGKAYCNPGSVGQPRDGDAKAGFATWDGHAFALHRAAYDIAQVQRLMAAAGFSPHFYENLSRGLGIQGYK